MRTWGDDVRGFRRDRSLERGRSGGVRWATFVRFGFTVKGGFVLGF